MEKINLLISLLSVLIALFALRKKTRDKLLLGFFEGVVATLSIPIVRIGNKQLSVWSMMRTSSWIAPFFAGGYCLILGVLLIAANPHSLSPYMSALAVWSMGWIMFVYFRVAYKVTVS